MSVTLNVVSVIKVNPDWLWDELDLSNFFDGRFRGDSDSLKSTFLMEDQTSNLVGRKPENGIYF